MQCSLNGKVALIFGGTSGIGKAIAQQYVDSGARVFISSRSEERLQACVKEIGAEGFVVSDSGKKGSFHSAAQEILQKTGGVDILVTNTGGPQKNLPSAVELEQWQGDYQSLFLSVLEASKVVLPKMREKKNGRIILVSSLSAKEPIKGLTTSSALRAGLSGLVKTMANEYAADGVTVNALLPGYTNTERLKELNLSEEFISSNIPAARLAEASEIAYSAVFLASDKAAYINGQSLLVDGAANKSIF